MKRQLNFVGHLKVYIAISSSIMIIGLIFNLIFGASLSISFKGGTMMQYSYSGKVDMAKVQTAAESVLGSQAVSSLETVNNTPVISITLPKEITIEQQQTLGSKLTAAFPNNKITQAFTSTLGANMGQMFFYKCLVAIAVASLFLLIYIGLRFRKIGGLSAGAMGLLALLHDCLVVYFVFIVFRIQLDDNFVAVVLAILGYSLNDTIVIFDRIRENRQKMDKTESVSDIVNLSINQSFTRSLNTAICTFMAISTVAVVALILHIDSITSFAVPMAFGTISGCYSTVCLSAPLWVKWIEHKEKKGRKTKI